MRRPAFLACAVLLALALGLAVVGIRLRQSYTDAMVHANALADLASGDLTQLSTADLHKAEVESGLLQQDLQDLRNVVVVPVPARDALDMGILVADGVNNLAIVGEESLNAFGASGLAPGDGTPTWLDAISRNQARLTRAEDDLAAARALRGRMDDAALPESIRSRLGVLERALDRTSSLGPLAPQLPTLVSAIGGDRPVRYLVLLQNPAELRPSGGFPGTAAYMELADGQLRSFEFVDVHSLSERYIAERPSKLLEPWPFAQYMPQDGFLLHDAIWWPDFPTSARQFLSMYAQTTLPPIDGIIAVEPSAVSDLVRETGSFDLDIEGEQRSITPESVYDEIDRERRWIDADGLHYAVHKDVVRLIGTALLDHVKQADRAALGRVARDVLDGCERRDIQVYAVDPALESLLDQLAACTGRLVPDQTPTVSVAFANLVDTKFSQRMQPKLDIQLDPPRDGYQEGTLHVELFHGGTREEDATYGGFQRWWVEVALPPGAAVTSSPPAAPSDPNVPTSQPDPDAPNGGAYFMGLFPGDRVAFDVRFRMPAVDTLRLRRQPGLTPPDVVVRQGECVLAQGNLSHDVLVDLSACQS